MNGAPKQSPALCGSAAFQTNLNGIDVSSFIRADAECPENGHSDFRLYCTNDINQHLRQRGR
jgi:hypothetical protein